MKRKISFFLALCFILVLSLAQGDEEKAKVDLKKVADKVVKAYTSVDPVAMANLYAEDAVVIEAGEIIRGREAIQKHIVVLFGPFQI